MFAIALLCLSALDLKHSECRVACHFAGYDLGFYSEKTKSCICGDLKDYKDFIQEKRLIIHAKKR